jgi:cytoskeletal protein CcmA (bactofilin family)
MSGPPPPPKRKNHKLTGTYGSGIPGPVSGYANATERDYYSSGPAQFPAVGAAHNIARALNDSNSNSNYPRESSQSQQFQQNRPAKNQNNGPTICILEGSPDAVIGAGVEINGEFHFDKLLRVDGKFQGTLLSNNRGDIVVGRHGSVISEVIIARKMIVEGGHVIGKIVADELVLMNNSLIKGDVTCKLIEVEGPHVTITGRANVHPLAPELVDEFGNIITEVVKVIDCAHFKCVYFIVCFCALISFLLLFLLVNRKRKRRKKKACILHRTKVHKK